MKSILISIQPRWCELIASGEKTVEVRKTRPNIKPPFKVYIYETQGRTETPWVDEEGHEIFKGRGQVIGEFICERIDFYHKFMVDDIRNEHAEKIIKDIEQKACITLNYLRSYIKNIGYDGIFYIWHISNLVIYDKPRELIEFKKQCTCYYFNTIEACYETCQEFELGECNGKYIPITRPPQSWRYVESEDTE